jgi:hypothetical protein
MGAPILDMGCSIQCPHGGKVTVVPTNTTVKVGGNFALLKSDTMLVAGCAFTLPGPKPSPCLQVEWSAEAQKVKVNGTAVLLQTSVGLCKSAEGAPQGPAMVSGVQTKVMGL